MAEDSRMGMLAGGGERAEINVTPMIDILLVLIITFMIVTLESSRGLNALAPQNAPWDARPQVNPRQVVITVVGDGTVELNEESVQVRGLAERLRMVAKSVAIDVVFIRGGPAWNSARSPRSSTWRGRRV